MSAVFGWDSCQLLKIILDQYHLSVNVGHICKVPSCRLEDWILLLFSVLDVEPRQACGMLGKCSNTKIL